MNTPVASARADDASFEALGRLVQAGNDLKKLGWDSDIRRAPKDGTEIEIIELGSTGIHKVKWHHCAFWVDGNWPSSPTMWRPVARR